VVYGDGGAGIFLYRSTVALTLLLPGIGLTNSLLPAAVGWEIFLSRHGSARSEVAQGPLSVLSVWR
jgi:hypothetical protein